jgi:cysteine desulfurase
MLGFKLEMPQREDSLFEKERPIYLDMQVSADGECDASSLMRCSKATTPIDPRVLDAMLPFMTDQYGNPHSRTHAYGWEAEKAVEDARKVCAVSFTRLSSSWPDS